VIFPRLAALHPAGFAFAWTVPAMLQVCEPLVSKLELTGPVTQLGSLVIMHELPHVQAPAMGDAIPNTTGVGFVV
jgi:hypothetical protein